MSKRLLVFSTPSCPGCKMVEQRLTERGLKFEHIDCTDGKKKTTNLVKTCEVKASVPVTVILDEDNSIKFWERGSSVDISEVEAIMSGAR